MTEDEAKTKWCPFSRLIPGVATVEGARTSCDTPSSFNRIVSSEGGVTTLTTPHGANCLASACMAWRSIVPRPSDKVTVELTAASDRWDADHQEVLREDAERHNWRIVEEPALGGVCGLAGAPN